MDPGDLKELLLPPPAAAAATSKPEQKQLVRVTTSTPKALSEITPCKKGLVAFYLFIDSVNGGYGPAIMVYNLAQGFPPYTKYFILPTSALVIGATAACSLKRTHSAMADADGSQSFIRINNWIDFFTFFNFSLDMIAAVASAAMGPTEAADAPWSISAPIFVVTFVGASTYLYLTTKKHQDALNSTLGKLALEFCQLMQVTSAGTSLITLVSGDVPVTWKEFFTVFSPSLGIGGLLRILRKKYPVLYKMGDDLLPLIAYLVGSGFLLQGTPYAAPFFILLTFAGFGAPVYALVRSYIPSRHAREILQNPTLVPGARSLTFQPSPEDQNPEEDSEAPRQRRLSCLLL